MPDLRRDAQLAGALHAFASPQSRTTPDGARGADAAEDKLLRYLELIAKWNRVYNLTAITDPQQMLTHHLLDSLAVSLHEKIDDCAVDH